ncbi:hypothetical protein SAY87_013356 [Trapa incisa]|uniref:Uncharacterized protein n=1 Tax=Trapa incisa TaxID=236973 RepID=A0AAN7K8K5_9MYRT|nr:hypothetical protein SAY87_013356 [Trapa incisa]
MDSILNPFSSGIRLSKYAVESYLRRCPSSTKTMYNNSRMCQGNRRKKYMICTDVEPEGLPVRCREDGGEEDIVCHVFGISFEL